MAKPAEALFEDESVAGDEAAVDDAIRVAGGSREAIRALLVDLAEARALAASELAWLPARAAASATLKMRADTLGKAYQSGWRVRVRCAQGKRSGMKSIRECLCDAELDMASLVWTRGRNFPIAMLAERLQCPKCGSRRVSTMFFPPARRDAGEASAAGASPAVRDPIGRVEQRGPDDRLERVLATASSLAVAEGAFAAAIRAHSVTVGGRLVLLKDGHVVAEHRPEVIDGGGREAAE